MLRAPSLAAQCVLSASGASSIRNAGQGATASLLARALFNSSTSGSTITHAVKATRSRQVQQPQHQQRRSTGRSSRSCGRTSSLEMPALGDGAQGCSGETSVDRVRSPAAMLVTRIKAMFCKKGNGPWWLAVHILQRGRQTGIKDVKVYNTVFKMIVSSKRDMEERLKAMERLWTQMKEEDGLEPEEPTYRHLINGYGYAGRRDDAVRLLEEMIAKGLEPGRRTLSNMIVAHSWSSIADMRRVAAEMRARGWRPTHRANLAMICALHEVNDSLGILEIAKAMVEDEQSLTGVALTFAIRAAAISRQADFARQLLLIHGETEDRLQEALFVSVMRALITAAQYEESLACWRELVLVDGLGDVELGARTFNLALVSAVKAGRWDEMDAIFDMMQMRKVEPTLTTWSNMVSVWSPTDIADETKLDRIFGVMALRGWQPTRPVRLHAAMAYARTKAWHKAMAWFEPAIAEDSNLGPFETKQLLESLAGTGRYGQMKEVWMRFSAAEDKTLLRASVLQKMAKAARELQDPDWALELHSAAMREPGMTRSVWQEVVRTLTKAGRLEAAAEVLEQEKPGSCPRLGSLRTLDDIVRAFGDLADPVEVIAFVDELRSERGFQSNAKEVETVSVSDMKDMLMR